MFSNVPCYVFNGPTIPYNVSCMDWGSSTNLVAYGCQTFVVVADPYSLRRVQCMESHEVSVTRIRWCPYDLTLSNFTLFQVTLASGDANGNICVWDVNQGVVISYFDGTDGVVTDLVWHPTRSNLLVSLHFSSSLTLWDVQTIERLWTIRLKEPLMSLIFNP
eukprot:TRINITY_DN25869_c0_g1_i1.p1 TRINITY_DN25869_c0_g1~~TRINITY_DN25869_c0_g1_i1.p1  ORF type:complete len:162 (-),score=19.46 TRINITY_DN25869_c0_g1_i1:276-761(-)